jgi:hypothetical protein
MFFLQNSSLFAKVDQAIMQVRSDMYIGAGGLCFEMKNSSMIA